MYVSNDSTVQAEVTLENPIAPPPTHDVDTYGVTIRRNVSVMSSSQRLCRLKPNFSTGCYLHVNTARP